MTSKKKQGLKEPFETLTLLNRNHTEYPDCPENAKLETFPNANAKRNYLIEFDCPEFTSLCPVTNQPDFGHITVRYIADKKCIESKSLKLYLFSYRNHICARLVPPAGWKCAATLCPAAGSPSVSGRKKGILLCEFPDPAQYKDHAPTAFV